MTVDELIEKLKGYPGNWEVVVPDRESWYAYFSLLVVRPDYEVRTRSNREPHPVVVLD